MCNILLCHLSPVGNKAPEHINCEGGPVIHPVIRPCCKTLPGEGAVGRGGWGALGGAGEMKGHPGSPRTLHWIPQGPPGSVPWDLSGAAFPAQLHPHHPQAHTDPAHTLRSILGHPSVCRAPTGLLQAATCMKVN